MKKGDLQDQSGDELIVGFRKKQVGKGYGAEGTCQAGNFVYAVVRYYIPFPSQPNLNISNVQYWNCSGFEKWQENRFGFVARATVSTNGGAGYYFDWESTL